jgi:hypothetical protein
VLSSTADLGQARLLPRSPDSSQQPLYCCPSNLTPQASSACRLLSGLSGRLPRACSCTTGFQRAKAGGGWDMCYSSHGLLPTRQRVLRAGDVAQLMRCRQSLLALSSGPPCPVAPVPFWASCARVRKRDEIMSVHIRTQTLHESRSGPQQGHCPSFCATSLQPRRARVCCARSRWPSTTAATRP